MNNGITDRFVIAAYYGSFYTNAKIRIIVKIVIGACGNHQIARKIL